MKIISEGETKIFVPSESTLNHNKGPGTANVPVFYNPAMEFSRDLSILMLEKFLTDLDKKYSSGPKIKLLDGLAGTGIRGVRIGKEIPSAQSPQVSIIINDFNPLAFKLISKNIELNKLINAESTKKDLNGLLSKNRFNYIDVDPFGSPIEFLDASTRSLRNNGLLAVSATDTAPLFGRYPTTCLRRYDAWSGRTAFSHELGPRILIGCCVRIAARYNLGLIPLLTHATDYYYRIYLKGVRSRGAASEAIEEIGYVRQFNNSNKFEVILRNDLHQTSFMGLTQITNDRKLNDSRLIGPLWLGKLYSREFIDGLDIGPHKLGTKKDLTKMLAIWLEEVGAPPGFYDANKLSSELKLSTPPLSSIINSLKKNGFFASHTHINPNAFKTDADFDEVVSILKEL